MKPYRWLLLLLTLFLFACANAEPTVEPTPTPEIFEKTLFVAPSTVLCDDDSRECLLVRESNADEYEPFDGTVNGFEYEAGYTYKLQIQGDSAETTDWTLVEILSQEGSFEISNSAATTQEQTQVWYLDFMITNSVALDNEITMTFGDERIQGFGGCNNYTAEYTAEGDSILSIDSIGATKKLCEDLIAQQERDYFDALSIISEYDQSDGSQLIFRDIQGTTVLTFVTSR